MMNHETHNALAPQSFERNPVEVLSDANQTNPRACRTSPACDPGQRLLANEHGLEIANHAVKPRAISERKLQANRANAKKSTGPRTARGKAYSSRNARKHGLTSQAGLFGPEGVPIDAELRAVWARLKAAYPTDDRLSKELLHTVVVECAHQNKAMELEESCFQNAANETVSTTSLGNVQRYRARSQRLLLKNLVRLRRRPVRLGPPRFS